MSHAVLNEDWSAYDNRKIRDNRDSSKFSCVEQWELNYLITKLRKYFPFKTDSVIRGAISACCTQVKAPRPREIFVECIVQRLGS